MAITAGRDRISKLPDSMLVTILSSLPIDEAARCSILASRWRHLFPSTLRDFKASPSSCRNVVRAVTAILAAHPDEPIRSFRTCFLPGDKGAVDGWLRDLSNRGIEELFLHFNFNCYDGIPESLFACSSLKRLRATHATFPDTSEAAAASLARLTEINLCSVVISEDSLNSIFSQCTVLEYMTIRIIGEFSSLRVRSRSLKVLNSSGDFKQLFIDDAPNLEQVLGTYMPERKDHIKVVHAPKLESLGYLGMSNKIEIGDTSFTINAYPERINPCQNRMPSIKTLAVKLSYDQQGYIEEGYIEWLMQLLKLFPCLETLYIRPSNWSRARDVASGSWEIQRSVPCIENHLQKVVIEVYRGHEWQRDMSKFFLRRSQFLKTMEFHCSERPSEEWVREQKELLFLDSQAATNASFLFFKGQLVANHLDDCHDERYLRKYYDDLYNESVLCGQNWRV